MSCKPPKPAVQGFFLNGGSFLVTQSFQINAKRNSGRASTRMLAFFFSAGILSGSYFSFRIGSIFTSVMHSTMDRSVSIVSLLLTLFLPFLLSWASCILDSVILFPICFCRGFLFSYIQTGFILCFPDTGWLLRWLVLFSDAAGLAVQYLFWLRCVAGRGRGRNMFLLFGGLLFLIGLVDFYKILPYKAF